MYDYIEEFNADMAFILADQMAEINEYLDYEQDMEEMEEDFPIDEEIEEMAKYYGE